jgi:DNA-binding response OmpR family regulator
MKEKKNIHILYVEDDTNLSFVIKEVLEEEGYGVQLCTDGKSAIQAVGLGTFDLCVLDVMLPHHDGFEVAEFVRKVHKDIPIIFVTAKSMAEDKIKGLRMGADDYITKPFSTEEFLLRIENILKRSGKIASSINNKDEFSIGRYVLNTKEYELKFGDQIRRLTEKEANLLRILCMHANEAVTREILLKSVWGKDDYFTGRSMDVFISKLRKYLTDDESVKIQVVHGIGFKLIMP